ncbi:MAG: WG repeat-containing protein, partial [Bacteroidota bacterium]
TGTILIEPIFDKLTYFADNGLALAKKDGKYGFIDRSGTTMIPFNFENANGFKYDLAAVKLNNKWGFIDKSENLIIQPYYSLVSDFKDDRAIVVRDGKFGLIDLEGNEVLDTSWQHVLRIKTGNYRVKRMDGRVGLVNSQGSFILRPAYDRIVDLGGRILVSTHEEWGMLAYSGEQILKINHRDINVSGSYTMVKE